MNQKPSPMNALEQQLHYPLGDTLPAPGRAVEVGPGVKWLRMGLPFALNHINLWLLRDELDGPSGPVAGWTVVDCGIDQAESRQQWEEVFAHELDGLPILRVLVTHMHPDHIGLAHWLCERWNTPLWISATDYYVARMGIQTGPGLGFDTGRAADFFAAHGLTDPASLAKLRARDRYYPNMVPALPHSFVRLLDGHDVRIGGRDWRCIAGYGHAPEHIALYSEALQVLISGDMVLPRISTNVSVYDAEPEADSLKLFLSSLRRYDALPASTLTLPSHGKPFTGLHARLGQLHDHHRDRLAEVLQACRARPSSAADILPVMFTRPLDLHQTTFALGEVVAHLNTLWLRGELRRERGADGVYRFS